MTGCTTLLEFANLYKGNVAHTSPCMSDEFIQLATIGHSNRSLKDFLELLAAAAVRQVIDIRSLPRSKRYPCYNHEALAATLHRHGIGYQWLGRQLGGLRKTPANSPHTGLAAAFRGFAEHMATAAFREGIETLTQMAQRQPSAIMCAEQNPQHCHRALIADHLAAHQWQVRHWLDTQRHFAHRSHHALRWVNNKPVYDRLSQQPLCF